jgi:hypothetical protein
MGRALHLPAWRDVRDHVVAARRRLADPRVALRFLLLVVVVAAIAAFVLVLWTESINRR